MSEQNQTNTENAEELSAKRLEELSPMVREMLNVLNKEEFQDYKIVDILEAMALSSGILVTTSLEEEVVLRAEEEGEQMFNYLMKGLRTYVDKEEILHGSVLLGVAKVLGFVSNFISNEETKQK